MSKKILFTLIIAFACINLMGCTVDSKYKAKANIKSMVTTQIKYIKSDGDKTCMIYTFEDVNGIKFEYESAQIKDGEGIPSVSSHCNYSNNIVDSHKTEILKLCKNSNLNYTYDYDNIINAPLTIYIKDYKDIKTASKLTYDVITEVGEIPLKKKDNYLGNYVFTYPRIQIDTDYNDDSEDTLMVCWESFCYSGEKPLTQAQLENEIMTEYVNRVNKYDKTEIIPYDLKEKYIKK